MTNKKAIFLNNVETLYRNQSLHLSASFREELLKTIHGFNKGDKISYLAYRLYPYVLEELLLNDSKELTVFKTYLERTRWKYYLGEVFSMAFVRL
ncbi:bacteriocin immunity protein [Streptococcus sp. zg-JUN1979]|uniref:bacteriocin immunity protein n=1 Tax=Streptococcus sp. zg-JUN1979 TaxID=3391450 RepID=UPI0039A54B06